ncbi:hypothetical protein FSARC_216 [Fusarium sarcochroum]|uniref:DUF8035 domain-containing protein n=1 Tax=Fusarium sarcochroum TaxID=1208366 RepID=A0A8H4XGS1_9HYPO|nr:hypothetical protein FSARC_216 [Fusarium sarcochroum]
MAERWDRDRFERARDQTRDRSDDGRSYTRSTRGRDHSDERYDRRPGRSYYDEDDSVRDRRYYGDDNRYQPQRERERDMPPPWARRTDVLERERERDHPRRESPPRRPGFLRRQSSLDTYDRRPRFFQDREEYPPPARREDVRPRDDYRPPPYMPIPLPKSRGLPAPRRYGDESHDDIKVAEPDYYGDEEYRSYPERVREKEYTRSRNRRGRSRESRSTRTRSVRSSSYGSRSSSKSSSSSGGTTVKSEYPKKGKTRIPAKLVSKRALIDLGYPFFEEGNTIIVQKALGQDNIDELLKVSEDYKKGKFPFEAEIAASKEPKAPTAALEAPPPKEKVREPTPEPPPAKTPPPPMQAPPPPAQPPMQQMPPPQPAPPPMHQMPTPQPAPPPMHQMPPHQAPPPMQMQPPPMPQPGPPPPAFYQPGPPPPQAYPFDYEETVIRDVSPSRSTTTMSSWDSYHHHHQPHPDELVVRTRSRSRSGRDIRKEIKALERELAHRPRGSSTSNELVRAERLPDGQVVIREERLEKVVEHRKPPRVEKDKKGRMSISVPKYR